MSREPVELLINVVHSPDFNATADRHEGVYFAFICEPVFPRLMTLAIKATQTDMMREHLLDRGLWMAAPLFVEAAVAPGLELLAAAGVIWRMAIEFIMYHELHHLLAGHVGFAREQLKLRALPELHAVEGLDQQVMWSMEYTADLFAALTVTDDVVQRQFAVHAGRTLSARAFEDKSLCYLAAVGVALVLCEFEERDVTKHASGQRSHPPVWTRYVTVIDGMRRRFDASGSPHQEWWPEVESLARTAVSELLREQRSPVTILTKAMSDTAVDEARSCMRELAESSLRLQNEWSPYAITNVTEQHDDGQRGVR